MPGIQHPDGHILITSSDTQPRNISLFFSTVISFFPLNKFFHLILSLQIITSSFYIQCFNVQDQWCNLHKHLHRLVHKSKLQLNCIPAFISYFLVFESWEIDAHETLGQTTHGYLTKCSPFISQADSQKEKQQNIYNMLVNSMSKGSTFYL